MTSTADITLTTTAHSDIGYGGMGFGECPRWSIAEQTLTVCDQYLGCLHRIKMNDLKDKTSQKNLLRCKWLKWQKKKT